MGYYTAFDRVLQAVGALLILYGLYGFYQAYQYTGQLLQIGGNIDTIFWHMVGGDIIALIIGVHVLAFGLLSRKDRSSSSGDFRVDHDLE